MSFLNKYPQNYNIPMRINVHLGVNVDDDKTVDKKLMEKGVDKRADGKRT